MSVIIGVRRPKRSRWRRERALRRSITIGGVIVGWTSVSTRVTAGVASALGAEEGVELVVGVIRCLLRQVVAAVEGLALRVVGPVAPDRQHVGAVAERAALAPEHEDGARDAPPATVALVELEVDRRAGPVVLADRMDRPRVAQAAEVLLERVRGEQLPARAEVEALRVRAQEALGEVVGLGQHEPVPRAEREPHVRAPVGPRRWG